MRCVLLICLSLFSSVCPPRTHVIGPIHFIVCSFVLLFSWRFRLRKLAAVLKNATVASWPSCVLKRRLHASARKHKSKSDVSAQLAGVCGLRDRVGWCACVSYARGGCVRVHVWHGGVDWCRQKEEEERQRREREAEAEARRVRGVCVE